jgi:plasmid stability protein
MATILDLPADLVENLLLRAEQEGRGLDETAEELLRAGLAEGHVADRAVALRTSSPTLPKEDRQMAIERLRDLRRGVRLDGETIRGLIEQGRRN